jgi:hypothetical protein
MAAVIRLDCLRRWARGQCRGRRRSRGSRQVPETNVAREQRTQCGPPLAGPHPAFRETDRSAPIRLGRVGEESEHRRRRGTGQSQWKAPARALRPGLALIALAGDIRLGARVPRPAWTQARLAGTGRLRRSRHFFATLPVTTASRPSRGTVAPQSMPTATPHQANSQCPRGPPASNDAAASCAPRRTPTSGTSCCSTSAAANGLPGAGDLPHRRRTTRSCLDYPSRRPASESSSIPRRGGLRGKWAVVSQ